MVERVRRENGPAPAVTLETLRQQLVIDKESPGLDECLVEQPDLYYYVAEGYALAVARRDAAKLTLEQVTAELDEQYRRQALEAEEKITEAALGRKLTATPRIKTLERELLTLRAETDRWGALKEAFQQRSYMLKELVQMLVAKLHTLGLERSVEGSSRDISEARRQAANSLRRDRGRQ